MQPRRFRHPYWAAGLFFCVALVWSSLPFLHPSSLSNYKFLFHDRSYALFTADQLLQGKLLFRDVFYQYGPLPAYLHAAWARVFGNGSLAYWHLAQFLTLVCAFQLWRLLRRACSPWSAAIAGVVILFPFFLLPGSLAGGLGASVYVGLERICLLGIALAWRASSERTVRSALAIGLLLGAMQWIKFGGAFVAGASLLAVDLLLLLTSRASKEQWLRWIRLSVVTLFGFCLLEGIWIGVASLFLHAPLASEVLWPSWMVRSYEAYQGRTSSLFHWLNFNYFVGSQLPIVAGLLMTLWLGARWLVRGCPRSLENSSLPVVGPALFLGIFFPLALFVYLPHLWVAIPYVWLALVPPVLVLRNEVSISRGAFCLACLPAFLLSVKAAAFPRIPSPLREWQSANDTLWLSPTEADRMVNLEKILDKLEREDSVRSSPRKAILGYPMGSGFHHFLGRSAATRHAWFMSGFVRPWEETALLQSLDRTLAVIVFFSDDQTETPSADPCSWEPYSIPILSTEDCSAFASHLLPPVTLDSRCWVFPVAPPQSEPHRPDSLTH